MSRRIEKRFEKGKGLSPLLLRRDENNGTVISLLKGTNGRESQMKSRFKKLSHTLYECKYHIVICLKYRHRIFKDEIVEYVKQQLYGLCRQKELVELLELNVLADHIHLVVSIPPKYSVSAIMGYKGKLSIRLY